MLNKKGKLTSAAIRKEIDRIEKEEMMEEFAGVIIFFLEKKYRVLKGQGK